VTLEVTATLTDEDNIFLKISIEQSVQTGETNAEVPIVDARSGDTALMLKDGQTVIMGGLQRKEKTVQVDKVPVLGDLPLVGFLFRNTQDVTRRSELVILLSLHIDRDGPIPIQVQERKEVLRQSAPITGTKVKSDSEVDIEVIEETNKDS
jgi:type II secretory pathway component GspD/PulD (secretin)